MLVMEMGKDDEKLLSQAQNFFKDNSKVKSVSATPFVNGNSLDALIETTEEVADICVVGTEKLTAAINRAMRNGRSFFIGKLENGKVEFIRTTTMKETSILN